MQNNQSNSEFTMEGRWRDDEQQLFIVALMKYGKNWKNIQKIVKSRTSSQVRSHGQKVFIKILTMIKHYKKTKKKATFNSLNENQRLFLQKFKTNLITKNTPKEIITLLKAYQIEGIQLIQLSQQIQNSEKRQKEQKQLQNQKVLKRQIEEKNVTQQINRFSNCHYFRLEQKIDLNDHEQQTTKRYETMQSDESYFMFFLRRNADHLSEKCNFAQFIDFGSKSKPEITQNVKKRKHSFQIPNEDYDDAKIQVKLQGLRNDQ